MSDAPGTLCWSDAQWQKVSGAVTEEFGRTNVAGQFLDCFGPLSSSAETVRKEQLGFKEQTVSVSDEDTTKLFNLRVLVELSAQQVADESLASGILAFRRAAAVIARVADLAVFNGLQALQGNPDLKKFLDKAPADFKGLVEAGGPPVGPEKPPKGKSTDDESNLITVVTDAIGQLENSLHFGPFACILSTKLFNIAHTPRTDAMVLPADRIKPLLGGPLLRSSVLEGKRGVVVSLSGGAIDVVVATPPRAQFLQITKEAKYLFRVYVRSIMRIKDPIKDPKDKANSPRPAVVTIEL